MWIRLTLIGGIVCVAVLAVITIGGCSREDQQQTSAPVGPSSPTTNAPVAPSPSRPQPPESDASNPVRLPPVAEAPITPEPPPNRETLAPASTQPSAPPAADGATAAAEKMAALRKAIEDLPTGNIVLAAPSKMTVGDEREVKASVGVDVPIEKLRKQSSPSDQQKEGSLHLSFEMAATLSGPGFTIAQTTPEKQPIAEGLPTVWSWNVTAKQEGEQALEATLYAIIGENRMRVESYTDTISVSVRPQTWGEWLKSLGEELGAVNSILVAIGGIVYMNWSNMSLVAKQIADANFFTGAFNHPNAFDKKITTEGQLVAFLVDENLPFDFLDAFFGGNFSIRFRRTDISDERINEIGQQPGPDIAAGFKACLESMK